ncbi:MAG: TolC family outer membrane protein [Simplicispira sp.]|nr:TolC family outer membrane protein [Simplicispira sp.]
MAWQFLSLPRRHRSALACLALLTAGLAPTAPAWALNLSEAYDAAHANDATVRAARAGAQATRERLPQARAQRLPNISASATRNYNDLTSTTQRPMGLPPARDENQYYSGSKTLSVRQPLYRPYLGALVRQAQAQVAGADAQLENDEQALAIRVGETYFDALLAREQRALIAAQKTTYTTQLDAAGKRLQAGSGTRTDIDEAQARLDLTLAEELEVQQNEDFTRHRLESLTGQTIDSLAALDVERFAAQAPVPASVQDWIERAEHNSAELQALRAQLEVARQEIEKAKSGHLPTLDAVAQWSRTSSDSVTSVNSRYDNKTIGLQLNVPLYAGGYVSSTVREAVAAQERARELLEAARRELALRVHREFRGMTEGVLRIRALEQAVRSGEQAVLSNRKSFEAGIRTTLDVLNAEQQKTLALRDLAQARYVYLVSRLRLQSLAGQDQRSNIAQANSALLP